MTEKRATKHWQVDLWIGEELPATSWDEARAVRAAFGLEMMELQDEDREAGVWMLELPDELTAGILNSNVTAVVLRAGDFQIGIPLP